MMEFIVSFCLVAIPLLIYFLPLRGALFIVLVYFYFTSFYFNPLKTYLVEK